MDPPNQQSPGEQGVLDWFDRPEQRGWHRVLTLWGFTAIPFFSAFEEEGLDPSVFGADERGTTRTARFEEWK